jgi:hypothetical protein
MLFVWELFQIIIILIIMKFLYIQIQDSLKALHMAQSSPEKAALKRCVFRRDLKERWSVQVISPIGSLFHSFDAATEKARSP